MIRWFWAWVDARMVLLWLDNLTAMEAAKEHDDEGDDGRTV